MGAFVLEQLFHKKVSDRRKARWLFGALAPVMFGVFYAAGISPLQAQVTSVIQGMVTDQQGLPIAGAEVMVRADRGGS